MNGKVRGRLALADIGAFNQTMHRYGVKAMILARTGAELRENCQIFPASVCIYRITIYDKTSFGDVIKYEREILEKVALARKGIGLFEKKISLRFDTEPFLTLEIDGPPGEILQFENIPTGPFQSAVGKIFTIDGAAPFLYDLNAHHQTLVAAVSGHGKSQLLKNCITGLLKSTPPDKLEILFIDFKNTDLVAFKSTAHTRGFTFQQEEAGELLAGLKAEVDFRISQDGKSKKKILLVIDEMAELDKSHDDGLSSIMKMGRSLGVHVLLATQHPTAAQIGQKIARSFTHRFVGRVDSAGSALWATGTAQSGAELLRKAGAFLYIFGGQVERFQTFYGGEDES